MKYCVFEIYIYSMVGPATSPQHISYLWYIIILRDPILDVLFLEHSNF